MLDGLLGRGFSSKCKSLIKPTKSRIELLRRRAEAKQRFLKEDLAKLLANGLDINAYGRTEEFLAGMCLLSCYDFIEQSYEYILNQLSILQKQSILSEVVGKTMMMGIDTDISAILLAQHPLISACINLHVLLSWTTKGRECPEECREAVSSLMFAAARFSDLPELRDLRDVFQERYGNSLEYFVNKAFVEKLASRPPTMEKRLQLLQDIALEFSIKWDSRGFEQRMANPSAFAQDQLKKNAASRVTDEKHKIYNGKDSVRKSDKHDITSKDRHELVNDGRTMHSGREANVLRREELDIQFFGRKETTSNGHKPLSSKEEAILKRDNSDISFRGRRQFSAEKHGSLNGKGDTTPKTVRSGSSFREKRSEYVDMEHTVDKGEGQDPLSGGKSEVNATSARLPANSDGKGISSAGNDHGTRQYTVNSRKVEDGGDRLESYYGCALPPPYTKLKDNAIPPPYVRPKGSSYRVPIECEPAGIASAGSSTDSLPRNGANAVIRSDRMKKEPDHANFDEKGCEPAQVNSPEKDRRYQNNVPLPKPRSLRRKHSKSSSSQDGAGKFEDAGIVKRSSSSRRKEHSRKGLQILFDDEHYQKDEEERMMDKLLLHYSKKSSTYDVTKLRKKSQAHPSHHIAIDAGESIHDRSRDRPDVNSEMVSTPTRSVSLPHQQTAPSEATKVFARANSFQPDNQARHVHPKLPDYDDLAARFAALRGR